MREQRMAAGLTQEDLARRTGISRQALSAIEAGRAQPSIAVALRLAGALDRPVDALFRLEDASGAAIEAELAAPLPRTTAPVRVVLARVGNRWVAHPLRADDATAMSRGADGLIARARQPRTRTRARVEPLRPAAECLGSLLLMGCDPALGLVADRMTAHGTRAVWLHAPSQSALAMLAAGHTHVAGAHLFDEGTGEFNVPFVRRAFPAQRTRVVTLAAWELGLVTRPRERIRALGDVLRPGVRFVHRESGSGARALVERLLGRAGAPDHALADAPVARGHLAVAQAIALGGADAGVATRAAARAHELAFVPLAEERFDLVIPEPLHDDPRVARLIDVLCERAFRRELACLDGYQTARAGTLVAA